jgi:hypothetical protein
MRTHAADHPVAGLPSPDGLATPIGAANGQPSQADGHAPQLNLQVLDGQATAFLEQVPGAEGIGHKLSLLLLGFLASEVVPVADRAAGLGIDPTPILAAATTILRLYADTLERPDPRRGPS